MFDQAIKAGEACRETLDSGGRPLLPAVCRCAACERVQMIASPLPRCCECGEALSFAGARPAAERQVSKAA